MRRDPPLPYRGILNEMDRTSHIFDGKTVSKETAAFQLCDIIDPMLKGMIEDPDAVRDTCDVSTLSITVMDIGA